VKQSQPASHGYLPYRSQNYEIEDCVELFSTHILKMAPLSKASYDFAGLLSVGAQVV
jgi:hypothetical protein